MYTGVYEEVFICICKYLYRLKMVKCIYVCIHVVLSTCRLNRGIAKCMGQSGRSVAITSVLRRGRAASTTLKAVLQLQRRLFQFCSVSCFAMKYDFVIDVLTRSYSLGFDGMC